MGFIIRHTLWHLVLRIEALDCTLGRISIGMTLILSHMYIYTNSPNMKYKSTTCNISYIVKDVTSYNSINYNIEHKHFF